MDTLTEYLEKIDVESIVYINKIPINKFIPSKHPEYNPRTLKYKDYWHDEMRKCIDGFWQKHKSEWKYIPGVLYWYGAHWHIMLKPKDAKSNTKFLKSPWIRDLEWIKSFLYLEARGFSGFEDDDETTCYREVQLPEDQRSAELPKSCYRADGTIKDYVSARSYLRAYHTRPYGIPLYENQAKNIVDLESRGLGKSYFMGGLAGHNYTFDGAQNYDEWMAAKKEKAPMLSETLIGAIDSKYSSDLIAKVQLGLDNLKGKYTLGKKLFPAPLQKKTTGKWDVGGTVTHTSNKKIGGQWITAKGSKFQHRSFKDNPFAANGTRPSFSVLDEIGFFSNLKEALIQMRECTADGEYKFGSIWMTGTGGDMDGGSTQAVMSVFYDPAANECLEFDDHYEGKTEKIGLFMPAWMGLNGYKDALGNTDYVAAIKYLLRGREVLRKAKDKSALNGELSQRPLLPSEVFLLSGSNVFPVAILRDQMNFLAGTTDPKYTGINGSLSMTPDGEILFKPDIEGKLMPCDWPVKKGTRADGCVTIYEQPQTKGQYGVYLSGIDPYDQDQAPESVSLGSIFIMRRASPGVSPYDQIVAEYTGRPDTAKEFYENCRLLLNYYTIVGTCLYENEKMGIKTYFENKQSLHLLASTPSILKANRDSRVERQLGQHMSQKVKAEIEILTRDWLMESAGEGKLNVHHIFSVPLLKELINYNSKAGNFDRVIALMLCVVQQIQMFQIVVDEAEEIEEDDFFTRELFTRFSEPLQL